MVRLVVTSAWSMHGAHWRASIWANLCAIWINIAGQLPLMLYFF